MLPGWASTWLELGLQDWNAIAGILGFLLLVGTTLAGGVGWFIRRRRTLPVSAEFGVAGGGHVDSDGVRRVTVWLQNTGSRAYLHDVCCEDYMFGVEFPETIPQVARIDDIESLPRKLRSLSKRRLRHEEGVFKPQYLSAGQMELFYVSCPSEVAGFTLVATMSIGRRGPKQCVTSGYLNALDVDDLLKSSRFPF